MDVLKTTTFVAKISDANAPSLSLFQGKLGFGNVRHIEAFEETHMSVSPSPEAMAVLLDAAGTGFDTATFDRGEEALLPTADNVGATPVSDEGNVTEAGAGAGAGAGADAGAGAGVAGIDEGEAGGAKDGAAAASTTAD